MHAASCDLDHVHVGETLVEPWSLHIDGFLGGTQTKFAGASFAEHIDPQWLGVPYRIDLSLLASNATRTFGQNRLWRSRCFDCLGLGCFDGLRRGLAGLLGFLHGWRIFWLNIFLLIHLALTRRLCGRGRGSSGSDGNSRLVNR